MPLATITDLDDSRLGPFRDLPNRNLTRGSGKFIAEGEKVVDRMLAAGFGVESLLLEPALVERYAALAPPETLLLVAEKPLLKQVCGFNFHRGVLGCGLRPQPRRLEAILPPAPERASLLVLAEVQDPANMGGILRSAAAFGVSAVVLGPGCADPFSRRVLRVSMAAALAVPLIETTDLEWMLEGLSREHHVDVLATVLSPSAVRLSDFTPPERFALLLGCEGHGLPAELAGRAATQLTIPMRLEVDSLNVSVAAAVFLYALCERRPPSGNALA